MYRDNKFVCVLLGCLSKVACQVSIILFLKPFLSWGKLDLLSFIPPSALSVRHESTAMFTFVVCACMRVHACATAHMQRPENHFWKSALFFYDVGSGN